MTHEALVTSCMLGTSLRPVSVGMLPGEIRAALGGGESTTGQDLALDAAAAWALLRAARLPVESAGETIEIPCETRPVLSGLPASMLSRAVNEFQPAEPETLVGMLTELARLRGNRVALPDELLVDLLELFGRRDDGLVLTRLLGPRDLAILDLMPDERQHLARLAGRAAAGSSAGVGADLESAAGAQPLPDPAIWRIGHRDDRIDYLRELRRLAPEQARELLADKSFRKEKASDRVLFVQTLQIGLGPQDDELLERLLADKSDMVKSAALKIAMRLPDSGVTRRAEALARSHVQGGRDSRGPALTLMPIEQTTETRRDGYPSDLKEHSRATQRVCHLFELIHPGRWLELVGLNFQEFVTACCRLPEFNDLLGSLTRAIAAHGDSRAAEILLMVTHRRKGAKLAPGTMLDLLDEAQMDRWLRANLAGMTRHAATEALEHIRVPVTLGAMEQLLINLAGWLKAEKHSFVVQNAAEATLKLLDRQSYAANDTVPLVARLRAMAAAVPERHHRIAQLLTQRANRLEQLAHFGAALAEPFSYTAPSSSTENPDRPVFIAPEEQR